MEGRRTLGGGYNNNNTLIRVVYLHASTYISSLSPSSVLTAAVHIEPFAIVLAGQAQETKSRQWWWVGGTEEWANDFYVHGV